MPVLSTFGAIAARGFGWVAKAASGAAMYAWGAGGNGQLGQGSTTTYSSPVQVGALTVWAKVACASQSSLAIKSDGTLWGWGYNSEGTLGTGNITAYSSPVQVGALTTWSNLYPHLYTTHAIKTDGTLWGWGQGYYGMIGVGSTTNYSSPVQIGALTTWASGTTGGMAYFKTIAIKTDGTLWGWGWSTNHDGGSGAGGSDIPYSAIVSTPSGSNASGDPTSPVQIGAAANWARSASGAFHSLAITTSGALYAWGNHRVGQLGVGTVNNSPAYYSPQPDYGQGSIGLCLGPNYFFYENPASSSADGVMAYDSTGMICSASYVQWNYTGANGEKWGYSSPVQVGALTSWSKIAGGYYHSLAIKTDGTLWAWGSNFYGESGTSNTTVYSSPVQVGALTTWANVSGGIYFTIATKTDGTLWAWGQGSFGKLGQGNTTNYSSPVQIGAATNWLSAGISTGEQFSLALRS